MITIYSEKIEFITKSDGEHHWLFEIALSSITHAKSENKKSRRFYPPIFVSGFNKKKIVSDLPAIGSNWQMDCCQQKFD